MINAILVGTILLVTCVVLSAVLAASSFGFVVRIFPTGSARGALVRSVVILMIMGLMTTAAHLCQIAIWAGAFMACGEFHSFGQAFYHSAGNYTTLSFGDIVMSEEWRLLGPLEAINGILQLGLSAAVMFTVMTQLFENRLRRERAREEAVHRHSADS